MKYFSMFSGIGGFELGIQQSGIDAECIGYSEIDKYASSIYTRHFPEHRNYGDATLINPRDLPEFDFLVGGFPCQAFSIAGERRGFDDTRGTLFFEIARILREREPRYVLLENVKGLLSHDGGETFQTILRTFAELGYDVEWEVLNSKNFGVPQNRERVFIKGYLRRECGGEILSQRRTCEETITEMMSVYNHNRSVNVCDVDGVTDTLTSTGQKCGSNTLIKLNNRAQAQTVYSSDGLGCCLSANGGGDGGKTGLYKVEGNIHIVGNVSKSGYGMSNVHGVDGTSSTLMASNYKNPLKIDDGEYRVRRLTPRECERLQGFPDDWTKYGMDDELISDTQRYKCCGNAVTVNVIEYLMRCMFT